MKMMKSLSNLASYDPRRLNLNQQRGLWSSEEQLDLAAPSTTARPWSRPLSVPVAEHQLGSDPGAAVTDSSPSSQLLCFWP